jgi:hypothetical protein
MALFPWGKSGQKAKGKGSLSLTEARLELGEVLLGDLHELKTTLAEARYENDFNNVKATFMRQEYEVVAAHLEEIRDTYAGAQMRTLRRDPKAKDLSRKEARLLTDKQATIRANLKRFDAIIQALQLKADNEAQRLGIPRTGSPRKTAPSGLPPEFVQSFGAASDVTGRAKVVDKHFCALPVNTTGDVKPATLYAYRKGKSLILLITADRFPTTTVIPVSNILSGKRLKPFSMQDFLEMGKKKELVELQPRQQNGTTGQAKRAAADGDSAPRFTALDLTAFNQLVLTADQSGLSSSILISNARDQYFRKGMYQHAFSAIERAYQEFTSKASQRTTKLREEEQAYKRGRLQMSPKQWQEKQRKDAAQTQKIERARKHFKLVLDGLRLLHLRQKQGKEKVE